MRGGRMFGLCSQQSPGSPSQGVLLCKRIADERTPRQPLADSDIHMTRMPSCTWSCKLACKITCRISSCVTRQRSCRLLGSFRWRILMPEQRAPSVRGRLLARELRRLRGAAALTGEAVAAQLGWSSAKISRIETAVSPITIPDLRKLLALYGTTDA